MKNILLATDLGANSDRAMERSLKLAKESGTLLHILHVLADDASESDDETVKENTERLIKDYMSDYKDAENLDVVIDVVQDKKPASKIPEYASEKNADLIIMGMHGEPKFRDLFLGTTAERVLLGSSIPILMVKDKPIGSYQKILCGVDFAPASRKAFRSATEIAPNAVFEIMHAYEDSPIYPNPQFLNTMDNYILSEEEREKEMVNFINKETEIFQDNNKDSTVKLQYFFIKSDPFYALIQEAEKREVDLICVGAHGDPSEKIGAVTDSLMADPPCDILVSGAIE